MVGISRIEARPTTGLFAFSDLGADFFVKIQKGTSEKVHMGVPPRLRQNRRSLRCTLWYRRSNYDSCYLYSAPGDHSDFAVTCSTEDVQRFFYFLI
jgi:hypothetical protein